MTRGRAHHTTARDQARMPAGIGSANLHYRDRHFRLPGVKLLPGEYYATGDDVMLVTVLGSCVAACIRDPERGVGGMNHFLLPHAADQDGAAAARYGSYAMEMLINALLKQGARRDALEAKVFGGANVVRSMVSSRVGQDNADFVMDYLNIEGIPVLAADLGGTRPRRVHYFPRTGQVMVRVLNEIISDEVVVAEQHLDDEAAHVHGQVELFE